MSLEESFTTLEVNNIDADHGIQYKCECGYVVKFKFFDFQKHRNTEFSNLQERDYVGTSGEESFLDFYCPSCEIPTTIQFSGFGGGMHGEYGFKIEKLVRGKCS